MSQPATYREAGPCEKRTGLQRVGDRTVCGTHRAQLARGGRLTWSRRAA